jgi:hypothetical protein
MSAKSKIILHMGVTLVVGIAIGVLLNRAVIQKRIRDVMERRAAGLFLPVRDILASATPEQEPKLREAFEKHRKSLAEIHDRFSREIQTALDDLKNEVDPLLTPEQKKRLETKLPGPPPFSRWRRGGFPPGGPPFPGGIAIEVLRDRLKLSDEQAARIKDILDRFKEEAASRFKEKREREPGREPGQGPVPFFETEISKMQAEIEGLLTEEQKALFRRIREERRKPQLEEELPFFPE